VVEDDEILRLRQSGFQQARKDAFIEEKRVAGARLSLKISLSLSKLKGEAGFFSDFPQHCLLHTFSLLDVAAWKDPGFGKELHSRVSAS